MSTLDSPDPLVAWSSGRWSGPLLRLVGLPSPRALTRKADSYCTEDWAARVIACGQAGRGSAFEQIQRDLRSFGARPHSDLGSIARVLLNAAVFDATELRAVADIGQLRVFFGEVVRRMAPCAHLLVVATDPLSCGDATASAAAQAVEGFVRSLAKEVGRQGCTVNLLYVAPGGADNLRAALRFFCSPRSAYVSGRALHVDAQTSAPENAVSPNGTKQLQGRRALVTGAARGLGAATAERLHEEGAQLMCVDLPGASGPLRAMAEKIGGDWMTVDITSPDAPQAIASRLLDNGGVDIVVHNAGITRDRTLRKMSEAEWNAVMEVNLRAVIDIDTALDQSGAMRRGAREICLSSISGIAGNVGQTNYAASKAALMGYVAARARSLAESGTTVNAVAPGFIETDMTRAIPFLIRQAGRRMNALGQGGIPRDVAEAICFLALPDAAGITGQTLRVCGQALLGS